MIKAADDSQLDMVWDLIDRCRAALLEQDIRQWDQLYAARESVAADIVDKRLYCRTASGLCRAVVTIDVKQEAEYATVPWTTTEPALSVHRLCVDPAAQGRGVGRQLMDYIETYAKHHRFAGLRLDAYSGNPQALAFYRRRGYREAGLVYFPHRVLPFVCFELDVVK
jgi:ribosomal protein S18 acetylase RimI-like enzyme